MAILDAEHKHQVIAGTQEETTHTPTASYTTSTTSPSSKIAGSKDGSKASRSSKAAPHAGCTHTRGSGLAAAARVHACAQVLALLLQQRQRSTAAAHGRHGSGSSSSSSSSSGASSSRRVGVGSKHHIKAAALCLMEALGAAGYERSSPFAVLGASTADTAKHTAHGGGAGGDRKSVV